MSDISIHINCPYSVLIEIRLPACANILFSFRIFCRNVLVVVWAVYVFSTHTGWPRILHTNTLKWFWSIHRIMQFVAIRKSTGSARLSWNIVNYVVLRRPARVLAALARDTDIHRRSVVQDGLPGDARIVYICAESDKRLAGFCVFNVYTILVRVYMDENTWFF